MVKKALMPLTEDARIFTAAAYFSEAVMYCSASSCETLPYKLKVEPYLTTNIKQGNGK